MTRILHPALGAAALAMTVLSGPALAHTAWFEQAEGERGVYEVYFGGHEGKLETYDAAKVKSVTAYGRRGNELRIDQTVEADKVRIKVKKPAMMITMHFDNGIFSRLPDGTSVNEPMTAVPAAESAVNAVKYHKSIVEWRRGVTQPVGQPFEVVPLSDEEPHAGQPFKVRVLIDGEPASGITIGEGEDTGLTETDADGVASFTPREGFNKLWAGKRTPVTGNPAYTEHSVEYLLTFEAHTH